MDSTQDPNSRERTEISVVRESPPQGSPAIQQDRGVPSGSHILTDDDLEKLIEKITRRVESRYSHVMSEADASEEESDLGAPDYPSDLGLAPAQQLPVANTSTNIESSTQQFAALFSAPGGSTAPLPGASASPPQDQGFDVDKLGLAWGSCYMQNEVPGPDINQTLASLVEKHVRDRPVDDELKKLLAALAIPGNCPKLVVPLLNKELEEAFGSKCAKICERTLARITALSCKAMAPLLGVLNKLIVKSETLQPESAAALSNALIVMSSIVNIANHGRKQNLQFSVDEPLLRHICNYETPVGGKFLFDFDVGEKLKELRKAQQIGHPGQFKSSGQARGRHRYSPWSSQRSRSKSGFRGSWRQSGQYYAASGRGASSHGGPKPFFAKGQRGRGKGQR